MPLIHNLAHFEVFVRLERSNSVLRLHQTQSLQSDIQIDSVLLSTTANVRVRPSILRLAKYLRSMTCERSSFERRTIAIRHQICFDSCLTSSMIPPTKTHQ